MEYNNRQTHIGTTLVLYIWQNNLTRLQREIRKL